MITRRSLLAGSAAVAKAARKPNFVFLIADDHAGYVLGADGNKLADTPNLDRLALEGTRFSANYCNSPVCTPSRQSFLTGQMPHSAGVTVLRTQLSPDKPTIAKQLKTAGYQTAVFGKMHFNRPGQRGLHGFDHMFTESELNKAWRAETPRAVPPEVKTKPQPWRPFVDPARVWLNADHLPFPAYEDHMRSATLLRSALRYLEKNREKPFAAWISFMEPHSPFDFPLEDRASPRPDKFRVPDPGPEDAWQIPLIFRDLSNREKAGINAAYYTSVRYLDRNIGAVLRKLGELGLEDNTMVVYMADHGYMLGQHGRFEKHCSYDPALRVPLLMRWPGRIRRGVVSDLTESGDVPHTILDLLGAPPLPVAHGRSLRPYLEGREPEPREWVFSEYLENEEACVRTATHKFVFSSGRRARDDGYTIDNPTPGRWIRLYDLKSDPGEFTNVAAKHPAIVDSMKKNMLTRFRETHPDAGREPQRLSIDEAIEWYLRPRDAA
jgi:arylsulfatase A-like enzyme